jgi:hypothetical protein
MRPANTDTYAGTPPSSAAALLSTCLPVMRAVTLSLIPSCESRRTRSRLEAPWVLVMGTFTKTLSAQLETLSAWRSISAKSSENTSNEIGRSGTTSRSSVANAS